MSICPECTNGKHVNCDGTSWDEETDAMGVCQCLAEALDATSPPSQIKEINAEAARITGISLDAEVGPYGGTIEVKGAEQPEAAASDYFTEPNSENT